MLTYTDLQERRKLTLLEKKTFKYVLYESNEEETKNLFLEIQKTTRDTSYKSQEFNFLGLVDFVGEVEDVHHYHIKDIVPEDGTCYQKHGSGNQFNNVKIHEDKLSGFKCACDRIRAKSFIVLKEPKIEEHD